MTYDEKLDHFKGIFTVAEINRRAATCFDVHAGPALLYRIEPKIQTLMKESMADLAKLVNWFTHEILATARDFNIPCQMYRESIHVFIDPLETTKDHGWYLSWSAKPGEIRDLIVLKEKNFPDSWHIPLLHELVHALCPPGPIPLTEGSLDHELFTEAIEFVTAFRMHEGDSLKTEILREALWQPDSYFTREWRESREEGRDSVIRSKEDSPELVLKRILQRVRKG